MGCMWRDILFFSQKNALQIQLFFDELETANPLDSKKGIHKLGGVYILHWEIVRQI